MANILSDFGINLLEEEVDEKTQIDVVHFGEPDSPEQIDCALNEESKAIEFAALNRIRGKFVYERSVLQVARNDAVGVGPLHHSDCPRKFRLAPSCKHYVRAKRSGHDRRRTAYAGRGTGDKDTPSGEIHGVH